MPCDQVTQRNVGMTSRHTALKAGDQLRCRVSQRVCEKLVAVDRGVGMCCCSQIHTDVPASRWWAIWCRFTPSRSRVWIPPLSLELECSPLVTQAPSSPHQDEQFEDGWMDDQKWVEKKHGKSLDYLLNHYPFALITQAGRRVTRNLALCLPIDNAVSQKAPRRSVCQGRQQGAVCFMTLQPFYMTGLIFYLTF